MSRQREWQRRMRALERCMICGRPASRLNVMLCPLHRSAKLAAYAARQRDAKQTEE